MIAWLKKVKKTWGKAQQNLEATVNGWPHEILLALVANYSALIIA